MEDVDPECVIKLASHMSRLRTNVLEFHIYPQKLCKADALKMSGERERVRESSQLTSRFARWLLVTSSHSLHTSLQCSSGFCRWYSNSWRYLHRNQKLEWSCSISQCKVHIHNLLKRAPDEVQDLEVDCYQPLDTACNSLWSCRFNRWYLNSLRNLTRHDLEAWVTM